MLSRRQTIQAILTSSVLIPFQSVVAQSDQQVVRKFCVFVQAQGGWDPTSFCDPKVNQPGRPVINRWSSELGIEQIGNISYAPIANNKTFFEKYFDRTLVINGVDFQSDQHQSSRVNAWTGRVAEGYPTTGAIFAATEGSGLPLPYMSFGGFSHASGATRVAQIQNERVLQHITDPNRRLWDSEQSFVSDEDWQALRDFSRSRAMSLLETATPTSLEQAQFTNYLEAMGQHQAIEHFAEELRMHKELSKVQSRQVDLSGTTLHSTLSRQSEIGVLAFKSGVTASVDLQIAGFDTHANHDETHAVALELLTDGIDHLWEFAEMHGIADRLFVVVGSDSGRTNHYNESNGKDHWPIGSYLIMEKDQDWTDRVVGVTDVSHFASKVNPTSLEVDASGGSVIQPKHVHQAIRKYLRIDTSDVARHFPLHTEEEFNFFSV